MVSWLVPGCAVRCTVLEITATGSAVYCVYRPQICFTMEGSLVIPKIQKKRRSIHVMQTNSAFCIIKAWLSRVYI